MPKASEDLKANMREAVKGLRLLYKTMYEGEAQGNLLYDMVQGYINQIADDLERDAGEIIGLDKNRG